MVYNTYDNKMSKEFKAHLSNVISYAKRHGMKKIILFVDHATYHRTANVNKFIKERPVRVKLLPKKAPHLNPAKKLVNAPLKSVVGSNRSYQNIGQVVENTQKFFREYRKKLCT